MEVARGIQPTLPLIAARQGPILFVAMTTTFRIGVTRDFLKADDTLGFGDIGSPTCIDESPKVEWEFLAENTTELRPDQIRGYDGLLVLASTVSAETCREQISWRSSPASASATTALTSQLATSRACS